MTAFASVDLPEPFGPISAWICALVDAQLESAQDLLLACAHVQISNL